MQPKNLQAIVGLGFGLVAATGIAVAQTPMCGSAQHADWTKQFIVGGRYYLGNFPYGEAGGWHCIQGSSNNDWVAAWDVPGGKYWMCIVVGQWPWGSEKTAESPFPMRVSDSRTVFSHWTFELNAGGAETNCAYEIWIHNSPTFNPSDPTPTITCDLMIEPQYSTNHGTYTATVVIDGVTWDIYMQSWNGRPLPHYQRRQKTTSTGTLRLSAFWKDAAARGWCSPDDWVGSVTCGFEPLGESQGQARVSSWDCWIAESSGIARHRIRVHRASVGRNVERRLFDAAGRRAEMYVREPEKRNGGGVVSAAWRGIRKWFSAE